MSAAIPTTRPVSTVGAWFGSLVAAWAAATVAWHVALAAAVGAAPIAVDRIADQAEEQTGAGGLPAHFERLIELGFEFARVVAPVVRVVAASAVVLAVAMFVAASALVRGSETGRRAVRALLVVKVAHSLAATAWLVVLASTRLRGWSGRFSAAFAEAARQAPNAKAGASAADRVDGWLSAAPTAFAVVVLAGIAAAAALWWLAGRPSVRAWCAARGTIAPPPARR